MESPNNIVLALKDQPSIVGYIHGVWGGEDENKSQGQTINYKETQESG